jgi:hypothetical protein
VCSVRVLLLMVNPLCVRVDAGLDTSASVRVINGDGGPVLGVDMSAMKSLGQNMYGVLQWRHHPTSMHMRTGILYEGNNASAALFVQLGLPDSHVSVGAETKMLEHTRLKCSIKVILNLWLHRAFFSRFTTCVLQSRRRAIAVSKRSPCCLTTVEKRST